MKTVSVWSGVYTAAKQKRGEALHADVCAMCHGPKLNGAGQSEMPPSPAIAGNTFLRKFAGANVAALFAIVRHTMPPDAPGTLTDQQTIDSIATARVSGMPRATGTAARSEGSREHSESRAAKNSVQAGHRLAKVRVENGRSPERFLSLVAGSRGTTPWAWPSCT